MNPPATVRVEIEFVAHKNRRRRAAKPMVLRINSILLGVALSSWAEMKSDSEMIRVCDMIGLT